MKPLPGQLPTMEERVYNYRISRARCVIENVFGIMAAKWRILLRPIECEPKTVDRIVQAIYVLHNFVIDECPSEAVSQLADKGMGNENNGRWRSNVTPMMPLNPRRGGRASQVALDARQHLQNFFNGVGAVEWQNEYA